MDRLNYLLVCIYTYSVTLIALDSISFIKSYKKKHNTLVLMCNYYEYRYTFISGALDLNFP